MFIIEISLGYLRIPLYSANSIDATDEKYIQQQTFRTCRTNQKIISFAKH